MLGIDLSVGWQFDVACLVLLLACLPFAWAALKGTVEEEPPPLVRDMLPPVVLGSPWYEGLGRSRVADWDAEGWFDEVEEPVR